MKKSYLVALTALAVPAAMMGSPAQAGGFLADVFVRPISPKAADALDKAHKDLGNPLDHAANLAVGVAANSIAPGTGAPLTGALEARRLAK